jgi:hypothetical protein
MSCVTASAAGTAALTPQLAAIARRNAVWLSAISRWYSAWAAISDVWNVAGVAGALEGGLGTGGVGGIGLGDDGTARAGASGMAAAVGGIGLL